MPLPPTPPGKRPSYGFVPVLEYPYLDEYAFHGTPCIIHGGVCRHDAAWLKLYHAMSHNIQGVNLSARGYSAYWLVMRWTVQNDPCRPQTRVSLVRSDDPVEQRRESKRLRLGLEELADANVITYTPESGRAPRYAEVTLNTDYASWRYDERRLWTDNVVRMPQTSEERAAWKQNQETH